MATALGFDIGGSSVKSALVDTGNGSLIGELLTTELDPRPTPNTLFQDLNRIVQEYAWSGPVGIGYPGVIKQGVTLTAAHLDQSFIGLDWYSHVRKLTPSSVALLNDADAAGLAELHFGAGQSYNHNRAGTLLMVTLGTGVGTAIFYGGRLLPNTEFGHMVIGDNEAEELAAASVRKRENLDWAEYGRRVDRFLCEVARLIAPDLIIIGGGISENFDRFERYLTINIEVVPARFQNDAGVIGAAWAAAQRGADTE
jgi:polyphosphate glucokinase